MFLFKVEIRQPVCNNPTLFIHPCHCHVYKAKICGHPPCQLYWALANMFLLSVLIARINTYHSIIINETDPVGIIGSLQPLQGVPCWSLGPTPWVYEDPSWASSIWRTQQRLANARITSDFVCQSWTGCPLPLFHQVTKWSCSWCPWVPLQAPASMLVGPCKT